MFSSKLYFQDFSLDFFFFLILSKNYLVRYFMFEFFSVNNFGMDQPVAMTDT